MNQPPGPPPPRQKAASLAVYKRELRKAIQKNKTEPEIAFLNITPEVYRRGWLRITHASLTEWEWIPAENRWILLRFNDACDVPRA